MPEAPAASRPTGTSRRRAAFLDRDGVINVDTGFVSRIEDFRFVPGALQACATLARAGWPLVIVTNQSGIGRGLYTVEQFEVLNAWMRERFREAGAPLAGVYFCPHHPNAVQPAFRVKCSCRKPRPGLLLAAAAELGLDLPASIFFGDRCRDLEAAQAAGIAHRFLLAKDGHGSPAQDCVPGLAQEGFSSLARAVDSPSLQALLAQGLHV